MDYKNGKIYRIVCEETGRQYIGSTCSTLVKRLSNHKRKKYNKCASKDFINPKIILIEDYPCDRKEKLLMRERYHMENTECVNLKRPIISEEERTELKLECDKSYRYRPENKQKKKEYNEKNREKLRKDRNEKITCDCGVVVSRGNISTHKKSKKHKRLLGGIKL